MTTTAYTSRVTNWPLFWLANALAVILIAAGGYPGVALALLPVAVAVVLVVLVNLAMTSMRTSVGPGGVIVRFGVFGIPRMRYPRDRIASATAEVGPGYRLGGYGVHWTPWRGTRLTMRSGPSLRLTLISGRAVLISVADPDAAVAVLTAGVADLPR